MTRIGVKILCGLVLLLAIAGESSHAQNLAGPQGPEEGVIRRQTWFIPAQDGRTMMRTTVFRPPGDGPFPLAVVNHGSTQNELRRAAYPAPRYSVLSRWLVARGYAVAVPQRPGHGETGGPYDEKLGNCAHADFRKAGQGAAASIAAAIGFMIRQPFVRKTGVLVVGQSAGGWGSLALAAQTPPDIRAVVAFAPGRGGRVNNMPGRNCAPERLIATAGEFGRKARVPILWLSAENDSYFGPELSKRMVEAFRGAGGRAEFHLLPPVGDDGHRMISTPEAVATWGPIVEKFLRTAR